MTTFSSMTIQQSNNEYRIWTPQGICIAQIIMPPDGQWLADSKVLEVICKALSYRWGCTKKK